MTKENRAGIADVAARAGVSITTVSHVLSGRRPVSDRTKAKVLEVVRELGYRPDPSARGLRTGRSEAVALVVSDVTNPFYPQMAAGLQDVLQPKGFLISMCSVRETPEDLDAALRHLLDRKVDGVVLASLTAQERHYAAITDAGASLVRLSGELDPRFGDIVRADDTGGMADAVTHVLERGHRRIGFVNGDPDTAPGRLRLAGYERALREFGLGIDESLVVSGPFTRAGGVEGAHALLALDPAPGALVCANDLIAVGALDAVRERGLTVPRDVAVTGFDDIEAATLLSPQLTTVHNPAREIGRTCARLILDRLSGDPAQGAREVVLPQKLIVRDST
ncbi:LacI family DNA-binding transcriptional regulator [Nocardiopsis sp. CT-R113]|uniref:LacI family DNA-binding transcriptional regulator n=1 Tax=Nocardiopsis codii TaxID=3065942 RepID=A0ABU7K590_9ACTN|nr:LacI family DNA-binding transcriptional regulator [Nocardiopsis sp. CT-R113]MEE2037410.1 LacI family DNA-binding transcriptional regulator [Nocardiopsis sp. CT-R113]